MINISDFDETLKKSHLKYSPKKYMTIAAAFSLVAALLISAVFVIIQLRVQFALYYILVIFALSFLMSFLMVRQIPAMKVANKKTYLESDLLYSARHLLLKLESGSSLINSIESVSKLNTNSSVYFKELMFDISMGVPLEDAIDKAVEYSPSKAYAKLLEEISNSLKTGADIQRTLKATLQDVTRQHLIQIQTYGKKLNPMSMFYMIIGTILPSLGTAMLVVATSLMPGTIAIDLQILLGIATVVLVIQVFFVLAFRSLKPAVIE